MYKSIPIVVLLATLSTSWAGAGVSVEHADKVDFSLYGSFEWIAGTEADDPGFDKALRDAVSRELQSKGLKKVDEAGDLLVRTRVTLEEQQRAEVDILGDRGIWQEDIASATRTGEMMREVGLGIVVVELIDGYSRLLVWQGVIGAEAQSQGGQYSQKRIKRLVSKMFKKYPPE